MTRIYLFHAGPTPWDDEDRLVGNNSLPLAETAIAPIRAAIDSVQGLITCVYVDKTNEAAVTVGKWVASKFKLRTRHCAELAGLNLGLWQGLDRPTLRTRFESSFPIWESNPLTIMPPQGESMELAVDRLKLAVRKILKRNRGVSIALPVGPLAMQIIAGILKRQPLQEIASHLHQVSQMETIDLSETDLLELIG